MGDHADDALMSSILYELDDGSIDDAPFPKRKKYFKQKKIYMKEKALVLFVDFKQCIALDHSVNSGVVQDFLNVKAQENGE